MKRIVGLLAGLFFFPQLALAQDLSLLINQMVEQHPRFLASQQDYWSTDKRRDAKFRDRWAPELNLSYKYGGQHYQVAGGDRFDEDVHEFSARLEQRLTDFGESRSEVEADNYSVLQKETTIEVVRQRLLMEAIDAYLQVQKAQELLKYARQSRDNIQEQTNLENMLVEKGKGYSSNVLQAKTQLAGAKARLNQSTADLDVAMARAGELFQDALTAIDFNQSFNAAAIALPKSLDLAIEQALADNPRVQVGAYRSQTLEKKIRYENRRNFYPDLALVGQVERNHDLDGHDGMDRDDRIMLEFNYPLNLGLSGNQHVKAARHEMNVSKEQEFNTLREIERSVRVAWRNYRTATENQALLENKVNIAEEFLRLAQEERKAGRRSLLEVLSAETTLINSQGELSAAKTDKLRSAFSVLYVMGALNTASIENALSL